MFFARRELRFAWGRFSLMGSVISLVAVLTVMLTGLSTGLVSDGISALRGLPVTHLAFQVKADSTFSRSTVDQATIDALDATPGIQAEPLGNSIFNAKTATGPSIDLAMFGVTPGGFVAAGIPEADKLVAGSDGVVITQGIADLGVAVGDVLQLDRSGISLPVVAIAPKASYGHVDAVYAPIELWRLATNASAGGASAAALEVDEGVDLAAVGAAEDVDIVTRTAAYAGSPGYSAETSTMLLIRAFLYVIAAMILGAFFTVWTIQRRHDIGLQRALGASTGAVVGDALGQVLFVLVAATAIGTLVGYALGALISGTSMPFSLETRPVLLAAGLLVVAGALGSTVALRRVTSVDPIVAMGGAR